MAIACPRGWLVLALAVASAAPLVAAGAALAAEGPAAGDAAHGPHIVFVTGDDEYGSEISMPMIAKILEAHHGMRATVLYAVGEDGQPDRHGNSIPGLEALRTADAAVFFMRFRQLPQGQLDEIVRYCKSGKPMLGLRTTTHAFKYDGPPNDAWNDGFGREYFGQRWISHYGHENSSIVRVAEGAAGHPIARGLEPTVWLHSWLYVMNDGDQKIPADAEVLQVGDAVKGTRPGGELYGERQPVSWTRELAREEGGRQRIFYTSLGHPRDFSYETPRRLLVNAIYWAIGREGEIPEGGTKVDLAGAYDPPDPH
ncbi:MAG: ThuA domain-containing protein [Pirellulales bacterium]|nr:ThuA domain-containing protein [Pirellulales bacterium]